MAYLTAIGTVAYNGYSFGGPRNSVLLEIDPIYDSTGRVTDASQLRFSIEAWITSDTAGTTGGGADTESHMTLIRSKLSQSGGALEISGFGYGDVTVNTTSDNRDVDFGPKVRNLQLRNVNNTCIVLKWAIDTTVRICSNGAINSVLGRLKEYVYSVNYTILPTGATVRNVQGHLEIFNNFPSGTAGGVQLAQTADDFRDLVAVAPLDGFMRNSPQQYTLSENKQRLSFSVTDHERVSDNAYPPGVSHMDFDHTITSSVFGNAGGFFGQEGTFSGSVQVAKPYAVSLGWEKALLLMGERLTTAVNNGATVMIMSLSITESVFERRVGFQVAYRLFEIRGIGQQIVSSGLFNATNSTSDATYAQSMLITASNRGVAGLRHDPTSEVRLEQCSANQQITIRDRKSDRTIGSALGDVLLLCPPKERSYLVFENLLDFHLEQDTISLQQMPLSPSSSLIPSTGDFKGMPLPLSPSAQRVQAIQTSGDSQPRVKITIRGRAYRIGFQLELPQVVTIMGNTVGFISPESKYTQTIVGYYNNCPIYAGNWSQVYEVQFKSLNQLNQAIALGIEGVVFASNDTTNPKTKAASM